MKRMVTLISLIVLATANLLAQTVAQSAPQSGQDKQSKTEFFPIDQVKPGMRAIGYSVFSGGEPKKFDVEILGVMKGFPNPQQNAVLSRLLGDEVHHTGVFQGMSGSPVYIDGKLLGAVAFGYQFAKDPIAGITPIQSMIDVFEQRQGTEARPEAPRPVSFSEIAFNEKSAEFADFIKGVTPSPGAASQTAASASGPSG